MDMIKKTEKKVLKVKGDIQMSRHIMPKLQKNISVQEKLQFYQLLEQRNEGLNKTLGTPHPLKHE